MNTGKEFWYDNENDIFVVHNGFENGESFKTNEGAGSIILDISTRDRVRGIEIFNASKIFNSFGISGNDLKSVVSVNFDVKHSVVKFDFKIMGHSNPVAVIIALPEFVSTS